ncbi:hypothetical protein FY034_11130 [Trichlorobacter lovleyi]|uniref:hypothetical protein n=1 Tax=Trichlorobacter lovleyi TaxID=313985 RepID=UPI002240BA44|nr:hypothetical protein [Trichlorobacter lovleyi]QOX79464.1 hypothetical protein FY034_11130 [Trichlorobacter lovleyi]
MLNKQLLINRPRLMLIILVCISSLIYLVDYMVDGSLKEVTTSFLGNLAFLPIYIMVVTLTMEQLLKERERQTLRRKLNMVIGVFFSEVGTRLFRELATAVLQHEQLRVSLLVTPQWKDADFSAALAFLGSHDSRIDTVGAGLDLEQLKRFLVGKRSFLVGLLENQNLLEHEAFTDLLWAVFHLVEELDARDSLAGIPQADVEHLNGDIKRVFGYLSREWVLYMQHLKQDYPYLFSLAVRMNPMAEQASPHLY